MVSNSSARRIQGTFIACLVLLGTCSGIGGTLLLLRWQSDRADRAAPALVEQSAQFFAQSLLSRKHGLEILRGSLESAPMLSNQERRDIVESASSRVPNLAANGLADNQGRFGGWTSPGAFSSGEADRIIREALRQSRWKRFFGRPATLLIPHGDRTLLVFVQPLRVSAPAQNLVSAVDLDGMVADLMQSRFRRSLPMQVVQGDRVVFRSHDWQTARPGQPPRFTLQRAVRFDGIGWLLEGQTRGTAWLPSAWFNGLLLAVGLLTGLALFGMVWATGQLRHLATTDELTALNNRRFFLERWQEEVERARRYGRSLSCLIIDVNGFKRINDRVGHLIGDQVLRQVAGTLGRQLRKIDVLARFGGDEFIVALPETSLNQASVVAEKLRGLEIEGLESWRDRVGPITLSIGAAQLQEKDSALDVVDRADQDLYASRRGAHISKVLEMQLA